MDHVDYFQRIINILSRDLEDVEIVADSLYSCIERGGSIWVIGNGGSATTANHFEVDLSYVRLNSINTFPIKVKSLSANSGVMSAIGNDIGFENVFSHQLMRQAQKGDVCVAISASGNSQNLIKAFEVCELIGVERIAIVGFDGGKLLDLAEICCHVPTEDGLYGPVEDVHLAICHYITANLRARLLGGRP